MPAPPLALRRSVSALFADASLAGVQMACVSAIADIYLRRTNNRDMKRLITLTCALAFASITFAQDYIKTIFPLQDGKVVYTAIVPVDSTLTAERLYSNARIWLYRVKRLNNNVVVNDYPCKIIMIETFLPHRYLDGSIRIAGYRMKIAFEFRDYRWKYTVYDITCVYYNKEHDEPIENISPDTDRIYSEKIRAQINSQLYRSNECIDNHMRKIIADMTKSISAPVEQW